MLRVTTAACALSNQCQYTVYLIDSYGDGWNGNVVTFPAEKQPVNG